MPITDTDIQELKDEQERFFDLVNSCDNSQLAQCAKLLAMYLVIYKNRYGEIPTEDYMRLAGPLAFDQQMKDLVIDGLKEATSMLHLVASESRISKNVPVFYQESTTLN